MQTEWLDWLENFRVEDDLLAQAYQQTKASYRAALKTGLALAYDYFGQNCGAWQQTTSENKHKGCKRSEIARPVEWTFVIFTPAYTAAARLTAACILPLLCAVPNLYAICVDGLPAQEALLSLELSGVENILSMSLANLHTLFEQFSGSGRLLLLHNGELTQVVDWQTKLPCYVEKQPPKLYLADPELFKQDVLTFVHGAACWCQEQTEAEAIFVSCHKAEQMLQDCVQAPEALLLTPGCEGFWLHKGLAPQFFLCQSKAFFLSATTEKNFAHKA